MFKIKQFVRDECGCANIYSGEIDQDASLNHLLSIREMTKEENNMYIMGSLGMAGETEKTKRGKKRQRQRVVYKYSGATVCRNTFMLVFDIGRCALESLVTHVKKEGAVPRKHGNTGKRPKHALIYDDIKRVVDYLQNFADTYGLPQPAAPRGRDNLPSVYLESATTKLSLHKEYAQICEEASVRAVKRSCFNEIWGNCLPHIKIASPREDVCATCDKHRKNIQSAVDEQEKIGAADMFKNHVLMAQKERELYNTCIRMAKDTNDQCPQARFNHYTFDYSQNVSVPHFSRQMGPVYFASLRKVQIFGVRIDGHPKQLNFLIDEHETMGIDGTQTHGPNAVISMLDYVLNTYAADEPAISLHADNCPGQNKNRYMLGYLQWRVITGKQESVEYLMQVPGHAKCLVDSGFGHLKKLYRRSNVETIDQLEDVVQKSSATNEAIRYPAWEWRDWKSYLAPLFRQMPGISKFQYFRIRREERGMVTVRTGSDQPEVKIRNAVHNEIPATLPITCNRARWFQSYETTISLQSCPSIPERRQPGRHLSRQ